MTHCVVHPPVFPLCLLLRYWPTGLSRLPVVLNPLDACLFAFQVLVHDRTVDGTTNGSGRVADLTFDELRYYLPGSNISLTAQHYMS